MLADHISEVIFLGLPGPTHHYAGLSEDNVASGLNRGSLSNPRQAALQVLELAQLLMSLGQEVAFLPPPLRPYMPLLKQHFIGSDDAVIIEAAKFAPRLLEKASSASSMWTANAATVAPAVDTADGKLHIVAANLFINLHRRIEAEDTHRMLAAIFAHVPDCVVHPPLSAAAGLCDEGAANHMRLSLRHTKRGLHVFVYGTDGDERDPASARQTLSASRAVKGLLELPDKAALFIKQNPEAIGAGVFHNDVIAVSNEYVLLAHEQAYKRGDYDFDRIAASYHALQGRELVTILIPEAELSMEEAVHTYLFNSQIVTRHDGTMAMIAPAEVKNLYEAKAARLLERIVADDSNPIDEIHYADLRQSMRNGGGPACLRLRVPVTGTQLMALRSETRVMADDVLLEALSRLIEKHYPQELSPDDLGNPELYHHGKVMLTELGQLMRLELL